MKKKIYISGKITGLDIKEAENNFELAEIKIEKRGYIPVNPMKEVPYEKGKTWQYYMRKDIALLMECDYIYMLDNWQDSKGAIIEKDLAEKVGIERIIL